MSTLLARLASAAARRPRATTWVVLLAIVAAIAGSIGAGAGFQDDFKVPGIESQRAQDLLERRFPDQGGAQATVVLEARDGTLARPGVARDVRRALSAIKRQPHVASVEDPFRVAGRISPDGRVAYAGVAYDAPASELGGAARERLEAATRPLAGAGVAVAMSGEVVDGAATGGFPVGEVIGLAVAVLLLVVVLRSLRAARQALLVAFAGVAAGFAALLWAATATDVPELAPTLAGMLGLGAGIDYALLLAARAQEELRAGHAPAEAARRANVSAGHSAVTAAAIVLVALSGLLVTGIPFVGRAG
ncbi:MAG TPA: MMPL family transporter, partial [Solirubrobacteraceae bacterium]|nr:MMPL family transporter [Solirubrobacteraceae bacterium]